MTEDLPHCFCITRYAAGAVCPHDEHYHEDRTCCWCGATVCCFPGEVRGASGHGPHRVVYDFRNPQEAEPCPKR